MRYSNMKCLDCNGDKGVYLCLWRFHEFHEQVDIPSKKKFLQEEGEEEDGGQGEDIEEEGEEEEGVQEQRRTATTTVTATVIEAFFKKEEGRKDSGTNERKGGKKQEAVSKRCSFASLPRPASPKPTPNRPPSGEGVAHTT